MTLDQIIYLHHTPDTRGEALVGDQVVLRGVHPPARCHGRRCVIHNPSQHHMRTWPLWWNPGRRLVERVCPHGQHHPDPDAYAYFVAQGVPELGMHLRCDGCCP